jgi:hypothetical protein
MRRTLVALMALPVVALGQGPKKDAPQATAPGQPDPARVEKRMRLARTLGLAEVLDLDTAQALKLGDTLARFDDRRKAARKQASDATDALRNAARGTADPKPTAADVDGAIAKLLDARAQLHAIDREMLQAVTKDLAPEQKARAALFLGRFRERIERHMWMMQPGMGGPGAPGGSGEPGMMRPGMMMERGQQGMRMGTWNGDDHLAARGNAGWDDSLPPPPFADDDN